AVDREQGGTRSAHAAHQWMCGAERLERRTHRRQSCEYDGLEIIPGHSAEAAPRRQRIEVERECATTAILFSRRRYPAIRLRSTHAHDGRDEQRGRHWQCGKPKETLAVAPAERQRRLRHEERHVTAESRGELE